MDAVDFSKKILHGSWHPRENTVAVRIVLSITFKFKLNNVRLDRGH